MPNTYVNEDGCIHGPDITVEDCENVPLSMNSIQTPCDSGINICDFKLHKSEVYEYLSDFSNNYFLETRMTEFFRKFPPLKGKNFLISLNNPFSFRFTSWFQPNFKHFKSWGLNTIRFSWMTKHSIKNSVLYPENGIVQIDEEGKIFYYEYCECTNNRIYEYYGFIFVDDNSDYGYIRDWVIDFSMMLKSNDETLRKARSDKSAFDGIFLPKDLKNDIITEIGDFINSRDLYQNELKLPWKRGYMMIGPPGNGKTSMIRAICNYWGLTSRDIQKAIQKDGTVNLGIFNENSSIDMLIAPEEKYPVVCVMEDIDKFITFQSGGSKGNADAGKVTLHDILKALDGIDQYGGIIVIATTNYAGDMSEAIMNRPGRFDRVWNIGLPTPENIKNFITYHKIEISDGSTDCIISGLRGYSMSFVEEFIKRIKTKYRKNIVSFEECEGILDEIHKHNKLYLDYFKGKDKDHRDNNGNVGFGR